MQKQRSLNTAPEVALRSTLHRRGLRFRIHRRIVAGTRRQVDIVFGPARVAVDVRGCYWHGHEHEFAEYERRTNLDYWSPKIAGNRSRDEDTRQRLEADGWMVIVVWACDDIERSADVIVKAVRSRAKRRVRVPPRRSQ